MPSTGTDSTTAKDAVLSSEPPHLLAEPARAVANELHELRVRIPVDLHRQLLSLKILRGQNLAETVSTALEGYFEDYRRAHQTGSDASVFPEDPPAPLDQARK